MNMYLELTFRYYFCFVKAGYSQRRLSFQITGYKQLRFHLKQFTLFFIRCFKIVLAISLKAEATRPIISNYVQPNYDNKSSNDIKYRVYDLNSFLNSFKIAP